MPKVPALTAPVLSIREAQRRSVSGVIRDAEQTGLVMFERHGSLAGILLSGTIIGLSNLRRVLRDDPSLRENEMIRELARALSVVLDDEDI